MGNYFSYKLLIIAPISAESKISNAKHFFPKSLSDAAVSFVELDVGFYLMLAYRFEFCKNLCVVLQEVPHSDKCVHYLDADLDGSFTS